MTNEKFSENKQDDQTLKTKMNDKQKKNDKKNPAKKEEAKKPYEVDVNSEIQSMQMVQRANMSSKIKKLQLIKEAIVNALEYFYFNDISLKTLYNKNPFPPKPLNRLGN